jgi:predicted Zn-dependent peptidase
MKHTVYEHKLPSGAQGLAVHVPGSAVVNVRVTFHSGYQFSDPKSYEVPHIMEHLLATVTKRHSEPNAFMIDAQKNGAYVNASTSADTNEYVYEFAKFELHRILDLIEEQVCEPLFSKTAFEAEKSNVREELTRNTTQHMSVCAMALAQQAFPRQWKDYGTRIGQLDDIKLSQMEEHYHRTHAAANARFYAAGDFPDGGEALAERFERIFKRLQRGERLPLQREIGKGNKRPITIHRDIEQIYYRTGRYFGGLTDHERAVLSLVRMVMVGGMGSRVLGEARRRGLAYSVGAVGYAEPGNSSFGFTGYVTPAHAADLFEIAGRSMEAAAAGECTAEELAAAQDLLVGSITRSTQTAGDILQWYIDRYDDEGIVRDFEAGLAEMRTVKLEEITKLCGEILAAPESGRCFLGGLDEAQADKFAAVLEKA